MAWGHISTGKICKSGSFFVFWVFLTLFKIFYLERWVGREKERKRNICQLPLAWRQMGIWATTQACALTGNRTCDLSVQRLALNPLSHTSQGSDLFFLLVCLLLPGYLSQEPFRVEGTLFFFPCRAVGYTIYGCVPGYTI